MKVGIGIKFKNSPKYPKTFRQVYEENIEYARAADALGYDYIVVPEHHSIDTGSNPTPFLTLAALARETKRIGLATQPLLLALYNPIEVAEQTAVLDVLSNGRAMLGLGVGYSEKDFRVFGVPFAERGPRMDEAVAVVLGALRTRDFSYEGRFYRVGGVSVTPPPIQQPHPPIFLTAGSRKAIDRAVRFGLPVNMLYNEATSDGLYDYVCSKAVLSGVGATSVSASLVRNGFIATDRETAHRAAHQFIEYNIAHQQTLNRYMAVRKPAAAGSSAADLMAGAARSADGRTVSTFGVVIGSPDDWRSAIQHDLTMLDGPVLVTGYTFGLWPEGMTLKEGLVALELFAKEIMPWLKSLRHSAAGGSP